MYAYEFEAKEKQKLTGIKKLITTYYLLFSCFVFYCEQTFFLKSIWSQNGLHFVFFSKKLVDTCISTLVN